MTGLSWVAVVDVARCKHGDYREAFFEGISILAFSWKHNLRSGYVFVFRLSILDKSQPTPSVRLMNSSPTKTEKRSTSAGLRRSANLNCTSLTHQQRDKQWTSNDQAPLLASISMGPDSHDQSSLWQSKGHFRINSCTRFSADLLPVMPGED
jgi:hypothetical protein